MEKYKLILDTDIGDDIDDAYALALALDHPLAELIGVTTVYQNTDARARIAARILEIWGKNVPVYSGIREVNETDGMEYHPDAIPCQYEQKMDAPRYAPRNDVNRDSGVAAVDFIVDSAVTNGPDLTVVAIGSLSNIAAAIVKNAPAMKRLRGIVLMGGDFETQKAEWNILCNPEAAKIVLESGCNVTCIGLDITSRTCIGRGNFEKILSLRNCTNPKTAFLSELTWRWHACEWFQNAVPFLHDPLAVYHALCGDMVQTQEYLVHVEDQNPYARGITLRLDNRFKSERFRDGRKQITVATGVQDTAFVQWMMQKYFFASPSSISEENSLCE